MKTSNHKFLLTKNAMTTLNERASSIVLRVIVLVLLPIVLAAQSNVDRAAKALETLAATPVENWKVSPALGGPWALPGDPAAPGFDDSNWKSFKIGDPIDLSSSWMRKEIILPARILGEPVSGPVKLRVVVSHPHDLWVNGESRHPSGEGEFVLTSDAAPGLRLVIAIKTRQDSAMMTPLMDLRASRRGALRLRRAELLLERARGVRQQLEDLALSLRVGQKLLSFDTYQTSSRRRADPGIDKSTVDKAERTRLNNLLQTLAAQIDVDALASGSMERFDASVAKVRAQLGPIRDFAKRFTIRFDANAHIDAAWLWREKETIELTKNTFSSVLNMMRVRPDFTYTQSSAAYFDWMERLYPDLFKGIQQRVKDGRWEMVGGMWVEPDCNLPSGEAWARQLLYGKSYFRDKFGVDVNIAWNPDSFGYNRNMPMFYANAGIDSFITQKISWNDTNVFPHRLFWWQSPDGSRVLSYFPFNYANEVNNPFQLVDWVRQFEANTGFKTLMVLFGVGDHGGGPSLEMIARIHHLETLDVYPKIEFGTAADFLGWVRQQDLSTLPTWKDELYLEYHRGTYTTQAKMKELNRSSEVLLTNAEKFSSFATLYGRKYDADNLREAWRIVLLNQFHDILPGSSIHEVYVDAAETYDYAESLARFDLNQSLRQIAQNIDTSFVKTGQPVVVFNPLSWERAGVVKIQLPEGDTREYAVFDRNGKEIPSQAEQRDKLRRSVFFVASNVPPLGHSVYELRRQPARREAGGLNVSPTVVENELFRVTVDPDSGWVKSIVDKRVGKEILSGPGNELQLWEDVPAEWDAWNIGFTGVRYPSRLQEIEVVEQGPVRATLRITRTFLKPGFKKDFPSEDFPTSFFTQDISLYAGLDRIDFKTDADWWEDKTMLKVAFPVTVSDRAATYEIPYGTIRRSTGLRDSWEKARTEVPALRWADLSQDDYGVALLNRAKYGYDIKGQVMRLSLLRSPKWPDPLADRGKHSIEYALYPHKGRVEQTNTAQRGYEYNNPLIAFVSETHTGKLGPSHSFVRLEPANLILTTVKKAEDGDAWIFQWYDTDGEDSAAKLTLPRTPRKVVRSDFLEADGSPEAFSGNQVTVRTKKNGTVTVKVYFEAP